MKNEKKALEEFFQIQHVDEMEPFFMNIVSGTDLWTFMSSNGGITAVVAVLTGLSSLMRPMTE